jgi:hypothetical protein
LLRPERASKGFFRILLGFVSPGMKEEEAVAQAERLQRMRWEAWRALKDDPVAVLNTLVRIEEGR